MSGGYTRKPKTYRLVFDDGDLAGLEVTAKGMSLGGFLELAALADGVDLDNVKPEDLGKVGALFERFARCLIAWNLRGEDGQPVPADHGGLMSQDLEFAMAVFTAWSEAVAAVDPTLPGSSGRGETEAGLRLADSSRSRAS
jgi:hypothetical protein